MLTVAAQWQMSLNPIWWTSNSCCFSRFKFGSCNRTDCMCVCARVCVLGLYTRMYGVCCLPLSTEALCGCHLDSQNRKSPSSRMWLRFLTPFCLSWEHRQMHTPPERPVLIQWGGVCPSRTVEKYPRLCLSCSRPHEKQLSPRQMFVLHWLCTVVHKNRSVQNYVQLKAAAGAFNQKEHLSSIFSHYFVPQHR